MPAIKPQERGYESSQKGLGRNNGHHTVASGGWETEIEHNQGNKSRDKKNKPHVYILYTEQLSEARIQWTIFYFQLYVDLGNIVTWVILYIIINIFGMEHDFLRLYMSKSEKKHTKPADPRHEIDTQLTKAVWYKNRCTLSGKVLRPLWPLDSWNVIHTV